MASSFQLAVNNHGIIISAGTAEKPRHTDRLLHTGHPDTRDGDDGRPGDRGAAQVAGRQARAGDPHQGAGGGGQGRHVWH